MKVYLNYIIQIFLISLVTVIISWLLSSHIVFNDIFFESKYFRFLFYLAPIITVLLLSIILIFYFKKTPKFIRYIILTFINIYLFLSVSMIIGGYCEKEKNFSLNYKIGLVCILILIGFLLIKWVLPKLKLKDIMIIGFATIIALYDLYYSLIIFYAFNYFNYWDQLYIVAINI